MQQRETQQAPMTGTVAPQAQPPRSKGRTIALVLIVLLTVLIGAGIGITAYYPHEVASLVKPLFGNTETAVEDESSEPEAADIEATEEAEEEVPMTEEQRVEADRYNGVGDALPTKQVAALGDIPIYSPIAQSRLTGVLFHQASYPTALVLTTQLPAANLEGLSQDNPVRVNNDQQEGDWVDADALHMYREIDATEMDTSIDVGAHWGSVVYAPVTGTVVLVEDYSLYGEVPDIKIHIQPSGHPELDVVLLHQYDPLVKAGDKVTGGITPLSHVRDIAKDLTDVQLGFCTPPDDPGNHSHVQVNNADYPGYREESLKNAYVVK